MQCDSCGKIVPFDFVIMENHARACYENDPKAWNGWKALDMKDVRKRLLAAIKEETETEFEDKHKQGR